MEIDKHVCFCVVSIFIQGDEYGFTLPGYPRVQRLTTGWKVRGSNPAEGEIFRTRLDRPWGPRSFLFNEYLVIPGGKPAGARS